MLKQVWKLSVYNIKDQQQSMAGVLEYGRTCQKGCLQWQAISWSGLTGHISRNGWICYIINLWWQQGLKYFDRQPILTGQIWWHCTRSKNFCLCILFKLLQGIVPRLIFNVSFQNARIPRPPMTGHPALKGHFLCVKGVACQDRFNCT